jgi:hypothetical protein
MSIIEHGPVVRGSPGQIALAFRHNLAGLQRRLPALVVLVLLGSVSVASFGHMDYLTAMTVGLGVVLGAGVLTQLALMAYAAMIRLSLHEGRVTVGVPLARHDYDLASIHSVERSTIVYPTSRMRSLFVRSKNGRVLFRLRLNYWPQRQLEEFWSAAGLPVTGDWSREVDPDGHHHSPTVS